MASLKLCGSLKSLDWNSDLKEWNRLGDSRNCTMGSSIIYACLFTPISWLNDESAVLK